MAYRESRLAQIRKERLMLDEYESAELEPIISQVPLSTFVHKHFEERKDSDYSES